MDLFSNLIEGFSVALIPTNLLLGFIGAVLGTAVGVLPGLGPSATIALLLPLTYKLDPVGAIIMLAGIYYGAMFGGSTTSILLNIPGENSSVVTCIDGYQMARKGRAGAALGMCAIGSFIGGLISVLILILIAPALSDLALSFGPPEYTAMLLLGLFMVVYLSSESVLKGLMAMSIGCLLGMVGRDVTYGLDRFTFGSDYLLSGLNFVPVAMGLYGISEVMLNMEKQETREVFKTDLKGLWPTRADWKASWAPILRGGALGSLLGVLPGGGTVMATFGSYTIEKRLSKTPERFGNGAIEGVAAPETANNASATTAFVPLLTLGIPTHTAHALIFMAMMIHGIRPGPLLMTEHPEMFWGVIASMVTGNLMLLLLNLPLVGMWAKMLTVPYKYLVLVIITVCVMGAYSVNLSAYDITTMALFGVVGYGLRKFGFPISPIVLSMVLVPNLEASFQQSMVLGMGDLRIFFSRPISGTLMALIVLILLFPIVSWLWNRRGDLKKLRQQNNSPAVKANNL
ncbi:tripartite tricarboxylate transporter permease [Microvirga zambiensis]|uniref:tripartite tricarboxylate transporter permease n=1 Tax=Microvirga zambiensis TaxID=1402137 RepID=UPI00191D592F|nr:tripartite tricarboxylate transporter permease [Microvirga zambiensis]